MKSVGLTLLLASMLVVKIGSVDGAQPQAPAPHAPAANQRQAPPQAQNRSAGGGHASVLRTPSLSRIKAPVQTHVSGVPRLLPQSAAKVPGQTMTTTSQQRSQQIQQHLHQHLAKQSNGASQVNSATIHQRIQRRAQTARPVRQELSKTHQNQQRFNDSFWENHHFHPRYWSQGFNSWGYAPWTDVNTWIGVGTDEPPYYYDEGYPQAIASVEPQESATPPPPDSDWLPLGVFAVMSSEQSVAEPTMFFQLALGKDGAISGTYYNEDTDELYPVEGLVDSKTQRTVWMAVAERSTVFETGLYNLTLSETPVEVHFDQNETQNWMLVRVNSSQ